MSVKRVKNPVIGQTDCPSCGAVLDLCINKNGCAYVYCTHTDDMGDRCYYRATFGKKRSLEMINQFTGTPGQIKEKENVEYSTSGSNTIDTGKSGTGFIDTIWNALND